MSVHVDSLDPLPQIESNENNNLSISSTSDVPQTHRFTCTQCNKPFFNLSILNRHMRVHTGEKPHICPICNKGFSQHGNMTKHVKTHDTAHLRWNRRTQSKPFKCPVPGCIRSFTAKTSLKSHLSAYHGGNEALNEYSAYLSNQWKLDGDGAESKEEENDYEDLSETSEELSDSSQPMSSSQATKVMRTGSSSQEAPNTLQPLIEAAYVHGQSNTHAVHTGIHARPEISFPNAYSFNAQCCHFGCSETFTSQKHFRAHLYASMPTIIPEQGYLLKTIIHMSDMLVSFQLRSPMEQEAMRSFAAHVKTKASMMFTRHCEAEEIAAQIIKYQKESSSAAAFAEKDSNIASAHMAEDVEFKSLLQDLVQVSSSMNDISTVKVTGSNRSGFIVSSTGNIYSAEEQSSSPSLRFNSEVSSLPQRKSFETLDYQISMDQYCGNIEQDKTDDYAAPAAGAAITTVAITTDAASTSAIAPCEEDYDDSDDPAKRRKLNS